MVGGAGQTRAPNASRASEGRRRWYANVRPRPQPLVGGPARTRGVGTGEWPEPRGSGSVGGKRGRTHGVRTHRGPNRVDPLPRPHPSRCSSSSVGPTAVARGRESGTKRSRVRPPALLLSTSSGRGLNALDPASVHCCLRAQLPRLSSLGVLLGGERIGGKGLGSVFGPCASEVPKGPDRLVRVGKTCQTL